MVKVFSISRTDKNTSFPVFRSKAIAVGSPTVGKSILSRSRVDALPLNCSSRRSGAVFGRYGWSGEGNTELRES